MSTDDDDPGSDRDDDEQANAAAIIEEPVAVIISLPLPAASLVGIFSGGFDTLPLVACASPSIRRRRVYEAAIGAAAPDDFFSQSTPE